MVYLIVPHIIVTLDLSVDGVCIHSPKINSVRLKPTYHFDEHMFVISPSMARSDGYDMKSARLIEDPSPTIFDKIVELLFVAPRAYKRHNVLPQSDNNLATPILSVLCPYVSHW